MFPQIANLASIEDTPENRVTILEGMAKLYEVRQEMLAAKKTVNQIVQEFPKMFSYQGALVCVMLVHKLLWNILSEVQFNPSFWG